MVANNSLMPLFSTDLALSSLRGHRQTKPDPSNIGQP
jgi:hypothetical protein